MTATNVLESIELQTADNPQRAVIWMHGLGADGHDFAPIVPELDLTGVPATRFVFPHANIQPVTINGGMAMRAWYDILITDIGRQEDETGIRASEKLIHALIAREIERGIDSKHIVLAGFSQGCAMTLHTGLRYDRPLAGLMALSGYLPLASSFEAERHPANQDTRIFMAHGIQDPVIEVGRAEASYRQLQQAGYDVQWRTYPMPHSVCPQEIHDIGTFLREVLI